MRIFSIPMQSLEHNQVISVLEMPKITLWYNWVLPYPEMVIDGDHIYCRACNKRVTCHKKFLIDQHARTASHVAKSEKLLQLLQHVNIPVGYMEFGPVKIDGDCGDSNLTRNDACSNEFVELVPIKIEEEEVDSRYMDVSRAVCTLRRNHLDVVVGDYKLGPLIIEGKTKQVYALSDSPDLCLLLNKDRITAGDGVKAHDLEGKAAISNKTNAKVFEILNSVGLKTSFIKSASDVAFISKRCDMIPIEWVTRRLATGSFLKRNPGVQEGYRFYPPKHETFFKDDANHDPQWSSEQIISAKFKVNGLEIGPTEVDIMTRTSILVFEVLEKVWATRNCALIDMKIEFGVDNTGEIVVADVIDSDSWRLWPSGDKRLMVDKQVYRNLTTVTSTDLNTVKRNFEWVVDQLDHLNPPNDHLVVILMGSASDKEHCKTIQKHCEKLGLNTELRVTSAHKGTEETIKIIRYYESLPLKVVFIAVAGRSNGLGPVVSGNSPLPVINCPPVKADNVDRDVWSSLNVPSGLGCSTVLYPEAAAINTGNIIGLSNYIVWSKLRVRQLDNYVMLAKADKEIRRTV